MAEYIEATIINVTFFLRDEEVIKYQIYSLVVNNYLTNIKEKFDFKETEIDLQNQISLEIIVDLFKKRRIDETVVIQSLIVLKLKYNIHQISS